jgi:hypothetical protein
VVLKVVAKVSEERIASTFNSLVGGSQRAFKTLITIDKYKENCLVYDDVVLLGCDAV